MYTRSMWLLAAVACGGPAAAQAPPAPAAPPLNDTRAFDYANALSYYGFDGCGDGLNGRIYRQALAAKFAQCQFSPEARSAFTQRSRLQARKSRSAIQHVIDEQGGLPVKLEGMDRTCHEQSASADYQALGAKLQRFAAGELPAEAVFPQPCDATDLTQ